MFGYVFRLGKARGVPGPKTQSGCSALNSKLNGVFWNEERERKVTWSCNSFLKMYCSHAAPSLHGHCVSLFTLLVVIQPRLHWIIAGIMTKGRESIAQSWHEKMPR